MRKSARMTAVRQDRLISRDALPRDRTVQGCAGHLPAIKREGPDDAGRFELRFELDRSQSQNLLASDGDGRLRPARALDRQLERFDGVRNYSGAHVGRSCRTHETQRPLTLWQQPNKQNQLT